jgi:hypothetical protein
LHGSQVGAGLLRAFDAEGFANGDGILGILTGDVPEPNCQRLAFRGTYTGTRTFPGGGTDFLRDLFTVR